LNTQKFAAVHQKIATFLTSDAGVDVCFAERLHDVTERGFHRRHWSILIVQTTALHTNHNHVICTCQGKYTRNLSKAHETCESL